MVPPGTRSVSIFLVNHRRPAPDDLRDTRFAFQAQLVVESPQPLVARPNVCGRDDGEWDERMGELQYRDVYEYAVGHNVATHAIVSPVGSATPSKRVGFPTLKWSLSPLLTFKASRLRWSGWRF